MGDDNHTYRVGDRVRAIKSCDMNRFSLAKGREYTVTGVSDSGTFLQLDGTGPYVGHPGFEFELVRRKLRVGDRVLRTGKSYMGTRQGQEYTIGKVSTLGNWVGLREVEVRGDDEPFDPAQFELVPERTNPGPLLAEEARLAVEVIERREMSELSKRRGLSSAQAKRLHELRVKYWPAARVPEPGSATYIEVRTYEGQNRYVTDLSLAPKNYSPMQKLAWVLGTQGFLLVSDSAGTEKLIAVEMIEGARVL